MSGRTRISILGGSFWAPLTVSTRPRAICESSCQRIPVATSQIGFARFSQSPDCFAVDQSRGVVILFRQRLFASSWMQRIQISTGSPFGTIGAPPQEAFLESRSSISAMARHSFISGESPE